MSEYYKNFQDFRDGIILFQEFNILIQKLFSIRRFGAEIEILPKENNDYTGKTVLVSLQHLENMLRFCAQGKFSIEDLKIWANILLLVDAYDFDDNHLELLTEILHRIANPEIEHELSIEEIKCFLEYIQSNCRVKFGKMED